MCGIVAVAARRNVVPDLLDGLQKLEYRGYDSCGVAVLAGDEIKSARSIGRLKELVKEVDAAHLTGETGIAHTRWATHGAPEVRTHTRLFPMALLLLCITASLRILNLFVMS